MRVDVFRVGHQIPCELRHYADTRVSFGVQRVASRLSWVGVWLMTENAFDLSSRIVCQIDAWLRGVGLVSVRHTDSDAHASIDCAVVRLEQAVVRRLRGLGRWVPRAKHGSSDDLLTPMQPPRLAVVLRTAGSTSDLSLGPWLRTRYGIKQVQNLTLDWAEWDALVVGDLDSPQLAGFKERLALARLGRAEAIVMIGGGLASPSLNAPSTTRGEVERVVSHLRSSRLSVPVIGLCVNEHWTADDCFIESEELPPLRSCRQAAREDSPRELVAEVAE